MLLSHFENGEKAGGTLSRDRTCKEGHWGDFGAPSIVSGIKAVLEKRVECQMYPQQVVVHRVVVISVRAPPKG